MRFPLPFLTEEMQKRLLETKTAPAAASLNAVDFLVEYRVECLVDCPVDYLDPAAAAFVVVDLAVAAFQRGL